ncbi:hypothetical protein F8M41_002451 [Gigaspora margarita]|uniref:Uncharacterized protein n=1 Tax=Gigaspora margarita TaxID=4874 RepID=A0A8H3XCU9_GIGMA|nr:hypothetical protein F8M41_002451 [Gigaspora margarita]
MTDISKAEGSSSTDLTNGVSDSMCSKHVRVEDVNDSIESSDVFGTVDDDYFKSDDGSDFSEAVQGDDTEGALKEEISQRNAGCGGKKRKDYVGRPLCSGVKSYKSWTDFIIFA